MDWAGSLNIGHLILLHVKVGSAVWLVASTTVVSSHGIWPIQVTKAIGFPTFPEQGLPAPSQVTPKWQALAHAVQVIVLFVTKTSEKGWPWVIADISLYSHRGSPWTSAHPNAG